VNEAVAILVAMATVGTDGPTGAFIGTTGRCPGDRALQSPRRRPAKPPPGRSGGPPSRWTAEPDAQLSRIGEDCAAPVARKSSRRDPSSTTCMAA
jgi:hypothetical protein